MVPITAQNLAVLGFYSFHFTACIIDKSDRQAVEWPASVLEPPDEMTSAFHQAVEVCRALECTTPRLKAIGRCLATFRPMQDQNLKALVLNTL
jgi:hypothetical protein